MRANLRPIRFAYTWEVSEVPTFFDARKREICSAISETKGLALAATPYTIPWYGVKDQIPVSSGKAYIIFDFFDYFFL